ncbi:hypothetical protein XENTR_v10014910 [Xenopus tropicalis]|nr:hypothetical protein XENTR_v10014910 [Xenopus tropicalis]
MAEDPGLWTLLERAPIDWKEPWLIGLAVFHILCLIVTYVSFKSYPLQICHFLLMVVLVSCAEYINEFAAMHWRSYSKQQYFDSSGMFISLAFSAPLLCNTIIIVVSILLIFLAWFHLYWHFFLFFYAPCFIAPHYTKNVSTNLTLTHPLPIR